jgi:DNA-binding XRE family transcriptional regulator
MNYAIIIKKLREKLILTQTEFAEILGVSFTTVSRWEKGIHVPTIKVKRKIVELCKINKIEIGD